MRDILRHQCQMAICKHSVNFLENPSHFSKFPGCIVEGYDRLRRNLIEQLNSRCEFSVNISAFLARFSFFLTWYIEGNVESVP